MKGRHGDFILIFLYLIKHVTARQIPHIDTSDLLGHLNMGPGNKNPLIVYVNTKMKPTDDDDFENEEESKEQAKELLYNYLLKDSSVDSQDPDDPRPALRQALRSRCQAVVECTSSCPRKKKKEYCIPNCKAVFDKLDLCYPSKGEKKNKEKNKPKKQQKDECDGSDECDATKEDKCDGSDECDATKEDKCDGSDECDATKEDKCGDGSDECGNKKQKWGKTMPPKWLK